MAARPLVSGDRSRPDLPVPDEDDGLYRTMPRGMAATYDRGSPSFEYSVRSGLAAGEDSDVRQVANDGTQFVNDLRPDSFIPISVGLWIELVFCLALDAVGSASYFYPQLGEVVDGGFAFIYAFAIELFFDWCGRPPCSPWRPAAPARGSQLTDGATVRPCLANIHPAALACSNYLSP
jgi:hypothetical protein